MSSTAELKEREKQLIEQERKVLSIKQKLQQTVAKADGCNREGRKTTITETELKIVPEDRKVYKAIGKMFVERPCADLIKEMQEKQDMYRGEVEKCITMQETLNKQLEEAENDFTKLYKQYTDEMKLFQDSQSKK